MNNNRKWEPITMPHKWETKPVPIYDKKKYTVKVELLPEGVYLATSDTLDGLIVEGETLEEVLALVPHIMKDLRDVKDEKG